MAEAPSAHAPRGGIEARGEIGRALDRGEMVALTWVLAVLAVVLLILTFAGVGLGPGGLILFRSPVWMWLLVAVFVLGWAWAYGRTGRR